MNADTDEWLTTTLSDASAFIRAFIRAIRGHFSLPERIPGWIKHNHTTTILPGCKNKREDESAQIWKSPTRFSEILCVGRVGGQPKRRSRLRNWPARIQVRNPDSLNLSGVCTLNAPVDLTTGYNGHESGERPSRRRKPNQSATARQIPMYAVDLDLVLRYVPPMTDDGDGIRLTRTIELPFPPAEGISVFSKEWDGIDDPLGYVLKEVTWDLDRSRFLADIELSVTGSPIAMIPHEIHNFVHHGWSCGTNRDRYETELKRGRKRRQPPAMKILEWDFEKAAAWDMNHKGRPKEFKLILQALVSTMAELRNNCGVAYAMLKTGGYFEVPEEKLPSELSPPEKRFREALRTFESLPFDQQWDWSERVKRRYPQLPAIVEAIH